MIKEKNVIDKINKYINEMQEYILLISKEKGDSLSLSRPPAIMDKSAEMRESYFFALEDMKNFIEEEILQTNQRI